MKKTQAQNRLYSTLLFIFLSLTTGFSQYLKVSENKRFLVTENEEPFFWMGDTAWELFHKLDLIEIENYFMNRSAKGYTVIQAVLLAECDGLTKPTPEGYLPLNNNDPIHPNEDYFKKVDAVVELAQKYNLYLAMLPTWGSHVENKKHPHFENLAIFTEKNALQYGNFLGNRYKDNWNVLWISGGDRMPVGNEKIWSNMIDGLRKGNEGKQLVSYHINGSHSITEYPEIAEQLDFYMLQSGHGYALNPNYKMIRKDYEVKPTKPVIDGEPVYEDIPIAFNPVNGYNTDYQPRRAMYWSVFAGAFGTTYGNNSVWQMNRKEYPPVLHPLQTWDEAINSKGSFQVKHLKSLLLSRPYLSRIPDPLLSAGDNSAQTDYKIGTRDGTLGKNDATYIMAYFPIMGRLNVNTQAIKSKKIKAWFYDPRTGLSYLIGEFENEGIFSPPWNKRIRTSMGGPDWVLVIDDASKNYNPPGVETKYSLKN